MYLDRTEDEDQKMTERWKADADGILVFVSDCPYLSFFSCPLWNTDLGHLPIDGSVLRGGCHVHRRVHPGSPAELAGYVGILSRKHLPASRRS